MAALLRKEERANLLSNLGPCCKALCFRRDSAIRKQLVKNEKVLLFPWEKNGKCLLNSMNDIFSI